MSSTQRPASRKLRLFLGELRAGADVETAAIVAEMSTAQAQAYARAEARGEYTGVEIITPRWSIDGVVLTVRLGGTDDDPESGARKRLTLSVPQ